MTILLVGPLLQTFASIGMITFDVHLTWKCCYMHNWEVPCRILWSGTKWLLFHFVVRIQCSITKDWNKQQQIFWPRNNPRDNGYYLGSADSWFNINYGVHVHHCGLIVDPLLSFEQEASQNSTNRHVELSPPFTMIIADLALTSIPLSPHTRLTLNIFQLHFECL